MSYNEETKHYCFQTTVNNKILKADFDLNKRRKRDIKPWYPQKVMQFRLSGGKSSIFLSLYPNNENHLSRRIVSLKVTVSLEYIDLHDVNFVEFKPVNKEEISDNVKLTYGSIFGSPNKSEITSAVKNLEHTRFSVSYEFDPSKVNNQKFSFGVTQIPVKKYLGKSIRMNFPLFRYALSCEYTVEEDGIKETGIERIKSPVMFFFEKNLSGKKLKKKINRDHPLLNKYLNIDTLEDVPEKKTGQKRKRSTTTKVNTGKSPKRVKVNKITKKQKEVEFEELSGHLSGTGVDVPALSTIDGFFATLNIVPEVNECNLFDYPSEVSDNISSQEEPTAEIKKQRIDKEISNYDFSPFDYDIDDEVLQMINNDESEFSYSDNTKETTEEMEDSMDFFSELAADEPQKNTPAQETSLKGKQQFCPDSTLNNWEKKQNSLLFEENNGFLSSIDFD